MDLFLFRTDKSVLLKTASPCTSLIADGENTQTSKVALCAIATSRKSTLGQAGTTMKIRWG